MPVEGEYEPSTRAWVREQVEPGTARQIPVFVLEPADPA